MSPIRLFVLSFKSRLRTVPTNSVNSSLSNASSFLPAKRGFKMACLNINSLVKHIDELRVLLSDFSVDILAINETKLDESWLRIYPS